VSDMPIDDGPFGVVEGLELDPKRVRRAAEVYEGHGRTTLAGAADQPDGEIVMVGASSLVIAASYWSLLNSRRSRGIFLEAARAYHGMKHPFFITLAICGEDPQLVANAAEAATGRTRQETIDLMEPAILLHDILAMMGAMSFSPQEDVVGRVTRLLQRTEAYRFDPIGRLDLPAHLYFDLTSAMRRAASHDDPNMEAMRTTLARFLQRVDESVGAAMSNQFHWKRLRSNVLPVEPEVLAGCMAADFMIRRLAPGQNSATVLRSENMTPRQMVPALVASHMPDLGRNARRAGF
jgi:hypothetical protein